MRSFYLYIMASDSGTLYVGFTNNLQARVQGHKLGLASKFTARYGCNRLIYFEEYADPREARDREKQIKSWRREKKEALIKTQNPHWRDLANYSSFRP